MRAICPENYLDLLNCIEILKRLPPKKLVINLVLELAARWLSKIWFDWEQRLSDAF